VSDFQRHAQKSGAEFEDFVELELQQIGTILERDYLIEGSGSEADFIAIVNGVKEHIECKGGTGSRPGAQRTDSVKKAVANGILMKFIDPTIRYVVYFSAKPIPESYSDQMLILALDSGIIDEIRYRENYDTQ
jgi:hypothetical protein